MMRGRQTIFRSIAGCIAGMLVFLTVGTSSQLQTNAASVVLDFYEDAATSDLCFRTLDEDAEQTIGYEVLGITLHRADINGHELTDGNSYVFLEFNNTVDHYTEGGNEISVYHISHADIAAAIQAADPTWDWYNEWNNGKAGVMYVNAIMATFTINASGDKFYSGTFHEGEYGGQVYDFGSGKVSVTGQTAGTVKDLMGAYSWPGTASKSIRTYFHKPYYYNVSAAESTNNVDVVRDLEVYGFEKPEFYTWNVSDEYNVGEGIPAGKSLTNGFLANRWFGTYSVEKVPAITKEYAVDFFLVGNTVLNVYNPDGTVDALNSGSTPWMHVVRRNVSRSASYYALRSVDIFELQKVTTLNGAYDHVEHVINSTEVAASTEATVNGEPIDSYSSTYATDPEKHIQWPVAQVMAYDPMTGGVITDKAQIAGLGLEANMETLGLKPENDTYIVYVPLGDTPEPPDDSIFETMLGLTERAEEMVGPVVSWNDRLMIDGKLYLDDTPVSFKHTEASLTGPADVLDSDLGWKSGVKTAGIPVSRANGKYPTTCHAEYKSIIPADGTLKTAERKGPAAIITNDRLSLLKEEDDPGILDLAYNEPVVVHVPVVAPVTVRDKETSDPVAESNTPTQLVRPADASLKWNAKLNEDGITNYDLVLDGTYTISFDPYQWLSENVKNPDDMSTASKKNDTVKTEKNTEGKEGFELEGYDEEDYEEFIKKREARFPFDVAIINEADGSETFYEPTAADGYTEWIEIPSNSVKIYIPTWAKESSSKFGMNNQSNYYKVEFKVTASNSDDEEEDEDDSDEEDIENSDLDSYVATFEVPVNISGVLYDFNIVGVNDADMFEGYDRKAVGNVPSAFAMTKAEKKAGTYDRFGSAFQRSALDGILNTSVAPADILPLRDGSSHAYKAMGTLWKGTTFSFSVKTIGDYADENDTLVIKPTLRYYDDDGNEHPNMKYYYTATSTEGGKKFIEVGSVRDAEEFSVTLNDGAFNGAWFEGDRFTKDDKDLPAGTVLDDVLGHTAAQRIPTKTKSEMLLKKDKVYSMSNIRLTADQRLLSGTPLELERNKDKDITSPDYQDMESYGNYAKFKNSMQTWYGQYTVPDKFFAVDTDKQVVINGVACTLGSVNGDAGYVAAADMNSDGVIDLTDYSLTGNLSENSKIWEKSGYIMVNFDITAWNGTEASLTYGKGSLDMWTRQGRLTEAEISKQKADAAGKTGKNTITLQDGDIALYTMLYSLSDKTEAGIFMQTR